MQYWDVVTRSFRIAWNFKYLWLIALFSGEGGASLPNFNYNFNPNTATPNSELPSNSQIQDQVTTWINDHVGLIVLIAVIWLVLAIALFIFGAICEGATVRASAEHDAERRFGLGWAWRSGRNTMWAIVRFRLLLLVLYIPLFLLLLGFAASVALVVSGKNNGAAAGIALFGFLLIIPGIPYLIYLGFLDRLGIRALVLEQLGALASIARGHRLLVKRLGRTLVVWLLSIAVGIGLSVAVACAGAIVAVPFILIGAALFAGNSAAAVPVVILASIVLLPLFLIVGGFLAAQTSTYWTLAFRRLDLDPIPVPYYPYQPAPPPQMTPPPATS